MWTNDCIFNLAKPIIWRLILRPIAIRKSLFICPFHPAMNIHRGWDKSPSLSIIFGLSSKTQWLSGLYYADFISFYSPTQLCGGGTTKSNSNELPISVPLSNCYSSSIDKTDKKASCGTSTDPMAFIRFLPAFCFSRSLRFREMSPP